MGQHEQKVQTVTIEGHVVKLTHLDKMIWPQPGITKSHYLHYLTQVSGRLLPFLKDRHLTVIRFPDGIEGSSFFQKNCPDYAPHFVPTDTVDDTRYIVCSNLATLIWLGNQLALEFHIPFQQVGQTHPSEIVFDLDPPDRSHFQLAVTAANAMKELFDRLSLHSFVKTSGNTGLQIYLPLPKNRFTYQETRLFTSFIARYLLEKSPQLFTIERLKKNRKDRLYIDYVQHAPGKTIVAPYSPRATPLGTVATPLEWSEVNESLRPEQFTMQSILHRLKQKKCPFLAYEQVREQQPLDEILLWLRKNSHRFST